MENVITDLSIERIVVNKPLVYGLQCVVEIGNVFVFLNANQGILIIVKNNKLISRYGE